MTYTLTTNHAASSYGIPVLVDSLGTAYGPADIIHDGGTARDFVARNTPIIRDGENLIDESIDPLDLLAPHAFAISFLAAKR